jgi:uncharacterized membrane protein YtjA (UPF0391 family)
MMFDISNLFNWAIIFLVVALVAGLFGFGGLSGTAMAGAKLLCGVALVLAIVLVIFNLISR